MFSSVPLFLNVIGLKDISAFVVDETRLVLPWSV
jgi:hypothetical protein